MSSLLPSRDGVLESSNGDANGARKAFLLSSESALVRLDDNRDGLSGEKLWFGRGPRAVVGARSISEDWDNSGELYSGRAVIAGTYWLTEGS